MLAVFYYVLAFTIFAFFALLKWNSLRYSRKGMPPGSLGWPLVGETLKFLTQGPDFMRGGKLRWCSTKILTFYNFFV